MGRTTRYRGDVDAFGTSGERVTRRGTFIDYRFVPDQRCPVWVLCRSRASAVWTLVDANRVTDASGRGGGSRIGESEPAVGAPVVSHWVQFDCSHDRRAGTDGVSPVGCSGSQGHRPPDNAAVVECVECRWNARWLASQRSVARPNRHQVGPRSKGRGERRVLVIEREAAAEARDQQKE